MLYSALATCQAVLINADWAALAQPDTSVEAESRVFARTRLHKKAPDAKLFFFRLLFPGLRMHAFADLVGSAGCSRRLETEAIAGEQDSQTSYEVRPAAVSLLWGGEYLYMIILTRDDMMVVGTIKVHHIANQKTGEEFGGFVFMGPAATPLPDVMF